ncbi:hypothetical protein Goklo_023082, partial [Gossypium klotzschianum]|nr:hypothetical protein [Gossypium klotzschianum]
MPKKNSIPSNQSSRRLTVTSFSVSMWSVLLFFDSFLYLPSAPHLRLLASPHHLSIVVSIARPCTLPKLALFNFEASPILDLRVIPTKEDCIVELFSCK